MILKKVKTKMAVLLCFAGMAHAATPMTHSWDTVKDVMGMHGKFDTKSPSWRAELDAGLLFAADHYGYALRVVHRIDLARPRSHPSTSTWVQRDQIPPEISPGTPLRTPCNPSPAPRAPSGRHPRCPASSSSSDRAT